MSHLKVSAKPEGASQIVSAELLSVSQVWFSHHVGTLVFQHPSGGLLVVGDIRGEPIGLIGPSRRSRWQKLGPVIDGNRDTCCGQVCAHLKMNCIIMLCDLHPTACPSGRAILIVALLRGDIQEKPRVQCCPVCSIFDLEHRHTLRHVQLHAVCSLPPEAVFDKPQSCRAAIT